VVVDEQMEVFVTNVVGNVTTNSMELVAIFEFRLLEENASWEEFAKSRSWCVVVLIESVEVAGSKGDTCSAT
jgi:hypothetical protein